MINEYYVQQYCSENISLIENYALAVADPTQTWEVHHRNEILENKSKEDLIAENRYYDRPASELIFLTMSEHMSLHSKGENNSMFGKHHSEEAKKKMAESAHSKKVRQYTKSGEFIAEYPSTKEAERKTGINQSNISQCCQGKRQYAGGYVWRYA